jgi:hypothetical protein
VSDFDLESRLGAYPSPWDDRNHRLQVVSPQVLQLLPAEYTELVSYAPIEDQGNVGSCVGFDGELNGRMQYLLIDGIADHLSAGWLYWFSQEYAGIPHYSEGSTNLGLMKAYKKKGACLEPQCPTDTSSPFTFNATAGAETTALNYRIKEYFYVATNPAEMKAAIYGVTAKMPYSMPDGSQGKTPIVTAFPVYDSFSESYDTGIVPMPQPSERLLGGHSSAIIGWKIIDGKEYWINAGSWGNNIGDHGFFYLPIDYPFYDAWLMVIGTPEEPTTWWGRFLEWLWEHVPWIQ